MGEKDFKIGLKPSLSICNKSFKPFALLAALPV